jgi:hypothetical protein
MQFTSLRDVFYSTFSVNLYGVYDWIYSKISGHLIIIQPAESLQ